MRRICIGLGVCASLIALSASNAATPNSAPVGEIVGAVGGAIADVSILRDGKGKGFVARPNEPLYAGDAVQCVRAPMTIEFEIRGGSVQDFGCTARPRQIPQMNAFQWQAANIARLISGFPDIFRSAQSPGVGRDTSPAPWRGRRIKESPYMPQGQARLRSSLEPVALPVLWRGGAGHVELATESGSLRGEAWSDLDQPGFARLNLLSLDAGQYVLTVEDNSHSRLSWILIVNAAPTDDRAADQRILDAANVLRDPRKPQHRLQALIDLYALNDQDYTAFSLFRFVQGGK